jgi:hypothetical protein
MITIQRAFTAIAAVALLGLAVPAHTATPAKKPAAKSTGKTAAKGAAAGAAAGAAIALSPEQLATAKRVHTGAAECEMSQSVHVDPVAGKEGMFDVAYKGKHYMMVPENTTTGAVRLEDKKNGVMWLQIANKSMLMNSKVGQRMVDNCTHPAQRG